MPYLQFGPHIVLQGAMGCLNRFALSHQLELAMRIQAAGINAAAKLVTTAEQQVPSLSQAFAQV